MLRLRPSVLLVALAAATPLAAQQIPRRFPPPRTGPPQTTTPAPAEPRTPRPPKSPVVAPMEPTGLAALVGVVFDSTSLNPLVGASVVLDGVPRVADTDSLGGFRIDSIPPGTWRIAFFHPLLDTLGLSFATRPIRFGPDSIQIVRMHIPSLETLAGGWCQPAARRLGPGALLGRVVDAETGHPVVGARASLVWQDSTMVGGLTIRGGPRVRTVASDSTGRIALCGLPYAMTATLQVERAGGRTPEIPVTLRDDGFAMQYVLLPPALVASADSGSGPRRLRGTAVLRGRVAAPDRRPIPGVRVTVEGTGAETTTDETGAFAIGDLPAGTWTVQVRRVGSRAEQRVVSLPARQTTEVAFVLVAAPRELETVVVRDAASAGLSRVGFEQRRVSGMGRYLTPEDVEARKPVHASDLLRTQSGITVTTDQRGRALIRSTREGGRACMAIYIDGTETVDGATELDSQLAGSEVNAVEIYNPPMVPAEFTKPGRANCGAIAFWTKTRTGARR